MWFTSLMLKLQPIVVVTLFLVFVVIFGLPAFNNFIQQDVFFKENHHLLESLPMPAITICVEPVSFKIISIKIHDVIRLCTIGTCSEGK